VTGEEPPTPLPEPEDEALLEASESGASSGEVLISIRPKTRRSSTPSREETSDE